MQIADTACRQLHAAFLLHLTLYLASPRLASQTSSHRMLVTTRMSLLLLLVTAVAAQDSSGEYWGGTKGAPQLCTQNGLPKLMLNQTGYVQYCHYMTDIPTMTSFTLHFWFHLLDASRTSTMFNYGLDEGRNTNNLTVQLESGFPQYWRLEINDVLVIRVPSPLVRVGEWHHALVSWQSLTGQWSVFLDGDLVESGSSVQSRGLVVPGGGNAVSGQHQNTLHNGEDVGQGLEGWMTLLQLSREPLYQPDSYAIKRYVKFLATFCSKDVGGDIIGWRVTPRKGYGGIMETPGRQTCGYF
ncbi:hypothetical protein Pcinc_040463 [Petrolisthes cinctipes]|uniref:Pentraxin (PTX) domain-containing protein n=1 Tax=Petrolisthes cinctipes TaxID=88211 RepID=A0AAE1EIL5_PETCI|nr:hypothetical protein Pcinc_040463 [Petrolisthes cinctipes]